jgi:hypothetical protein
MKLYDRVKKMLELDHRLRSDDKALLWSLTPRHDSYVMTKEEFMSAPTYESVTRARRKVQELHPELQAVKSVRIARMKKELNFPSFVFREELPKGQTGLGI